MAGQNGTNALALWYFLKRCHAATPDEPFAINAREMVKAKALPLGRDSILNATKALLKAGAIKKHGTWHMVTPQQVATVQAGIGV